MTTHIHSLPTPALPGSGLRDRRLRFTSASQPGMAPSAPVLEFSAVCPIVYWKANPVKTGSGGPHCGPAQAVKKVQGLFRQPAKMPLLSRRCAAEKSSLRSLNALPSKAFRAFDPTRGGLPPPRAPPSILGRIRLNRGFSTSRAGPPMRSRSAFQDVITVYWAARKQSRLQRR